MRALRCRGAAQDGFCHGAGWGILEAVERGFLGAWFEGFGLVALGEKGVWLMGIMSSRLAWRCCSLLASLLCNS